MAKYLRKNKFWVLAVVCFLLASYVVAAELDTYYRSSKGYATIRAAAVLTTGYVATLALEKAEHSRVALEFDITQGSITSLEYKVYCSHDGAIWFQEGSESVGAGVITDRVHYYTIAVAGDFKYYKLIPVHTRYMRLEVKGTGTVTGSSLTVYAAAVE